MRPFGQRILRSQTTASQSAGVVRILPSYSKQTDKPAALRDIIEVRSADNLLIRSGYSP
ncbi:MAG: hypothetical protein ABJF01_15440 [bacterium]